MGALVMAPDANHSTSCEFFDKVPRRFGGHGDFSSYREDSILWINVATLPSTKRGAAVMRRVQGEAQTAAKAI